MSIGDILIRLGRSLRDRRGATSIEYGLVCLLIAVAIIAGVRALAAPTIAQLDHVGTTVDQSY